MSSALPFVPKCMSLNMQVFSQPFLSSGLFFTVHLKPCLDNSVDCSSKVTRKYALQQLYQGLEEGQVFSGAGIRAFPAGCMQFPGP